MPDEQVTNVTDEEINKVADSMEPSEEDLIDQDEIKAEIAYGKAIVEAEEKLNRAKNRVREKKEGLIESHGDAYGVKVWGTHNIFQCHYCALDVPDYDEARMIEHVRVTHPEPRGPHLFNDVGDWIGD